MAAIDTFRDARRIVLSRYIDSITMAGTHLAHAKGYEGSLLADLHRELADGHASAAVTWKEIHNDYGAAEAAVRARFDDAAMEARELELAARFHHVMDLAPVAA